MANALTGDYRKARHRRMLGWAVMKARAGGNKPLRQAFCGMR
jgi:hypothetical protein